ncbi:MAG: hypothetical protein NTZ65_05120 [Candidatus Berkelbacteria bacterium]|nr:hypothetical protein [Candidatus Berkelbacteria bacterium]
MMRIEIDQSGKIEDTNRLTVIAFSNAKTGSILITAKDKKKIQSIYRKLGQPRIFVYKLFAVAIFALVKAERQRIGQIVIDREYIGFEELIKQFIYEIFERNNQKLSKGTIHFSLIGKKSRAHQVAFVAFKHKRADLKLDEQKFRRFAFKKQKPGIA